MQQQENSLFASTLLSPSSFSSKSTLPSSMHPPYPFHSLAYSILGIFDDVDDNSASMRRAKEHLEELRRAREEREKEREEQIQRYLSRSNISIQ